MFRLFGRLLGRLSDLCVLFAIFIAVSVSGIVVAQSAQNPSHENVAPQSSLNAVALSALRYAEMKRMDAQVLDLDAVMGEAQDVALLGFKKPKFKKLKFKKPKWKTLKLGNRVKRKGDKLEAVVDLSTQRISVYVDGVRIHKWWVSSGRWGYETPPGTYKPERMYRKYYSKKYDGAPMPNSVFFHGGYAIHGSYALLKMGRKASHGCIRLTPPRARQFYNLVQAHGKSNTTIRIVR